MLSLIILLIVSPVEAGPLHDAARKGDIEVVQRLIIRGADVDEKDEKGGTPLHEAAKEGHRDVVRLLIAESANIDARGPLGLSPLHIAAAKGYTDVAELLIINGAFINKKDAKGFTPMMLALLTGHKETAALLEKHGGVKRSNLSSPLRSPHSIHNAEDIETVKRLISRGANVNVKTGDGNTPLHGAATKGRKAVAEFFIAKGAKINVKNKYGSTPLSLAESWGHKDVAYMIRQHGSTEVASIAKRDISKARPIQEDSKPPTVKQHDAPKKVAPKPVRRKPPAKSLYVAAEEGDLEQVDARIAEGLDVNKKDWRGNRPLHYAALNGHAKVVRRLLEGGAEVDGTNSRGATSLHWAAAKGHTDIVKMLIVAGADVNAENNDGVTPLHGAADKGHRPVVDLLVSKGGNINAKDKAFGATPLHHAADKGHRSVAELLIAEGADIHAKNKGGRTPLHAASQQGHGEVVKLLLAAKANPNVKDQSGFTPLHAASLGDYRYIASLLLDHGAAPKMKDKEGNTPLHVAAANGQKSVAELLIDRGVDIHARDKNDFTPLHEAAQFGKVSVAALLIDRGADVNAKGVLKQGALVYEVTPLHLAAIVGSVKVARLLLVSSADVHRKADSFGVVTAKGLAEARFRNAKSRKELLETDKLVRLLTLAQEGKEWRTLYPASPLERLARLRLARFGRQLIDTVAVERDWTLAFPTVPITDGLPGRARATPWIKSGTWSLEAPALWYGIPMGLDMFGGGAVGATERLLKGSYPQITAHGSEFVLNGGPFVMGSAKLYSDPEYPILLRLIRERGLVYVAGRGRVEYPDGIVRHLGVNHTIDMLLQFTDSEDSLKREAAAWGLGRLPSEGKIRANVKKVLRLMVKDEEITVRLAAAESLNRIGSDEDRARLEKTPGLKLEQYRAESQRFADLTMLMHGRGVYRIPVEE